MSPRNWPDRIQDIIKSINDIFLFVGETEFSQFEVDNKTISAVELKFIVIGEAASAIPQEIQEKYPNVEWMLMRGLRNRLVHMYFSVSPQILWNTIIQDLPPVRSSLENILKEESNL